MFNVKWCALPVHHGLNRIAYLFKATFSYAFLRNVSPKISFKFSWGFLLMFHIDNGSPIFQVIVSGQTGNKQAIIWCSDEPIYIHMYMHCWTIYIFIHRWTHNLSACKLNIATYRYIICTNCNSATSVKCLSNITQCLAHLRNFQKYMQLAEWTLYKGMIGDISTRVVLPPVCSKPCPYQLHESQTHLQYWISASQTMSGIMFMFMLSVIIPQFSMNIYLELQLLDFVS